MINLIYIILLSIASVSLQSKAPTYIYAHGLANTAAQAFNYKGVLFNGPIVTFDFPDATRNFWRVNVDKCALGQKKEIEHLVGIIQDRLELDPTATFIGIGISRGAATWLNMMGTYGLKSVKALIVESPPDSMENAVTPGLHFLLPLIFMEYDINGIQPKEVIHNIPKDLPILLVCTKDDHRVPYTSTVAVYRLLKESGHINTHILVFESGIHGKFVLGKNRTKYKNVAQAFYKQYGLPYDKNAAKAGQKLFKTTQPAPKDLL